MEKIRKQDLRELSQKQHELIVECMSLMKSLAERLDKYNRKYQRDLFRLQEGLKDE